MSQFLPMKCEKINQLVVTWPTIFEKRMTFFSVFSFLQVPVLQPMDLMVEAMPRRVFSNAHTYHINSISVNSDYETFMSTDDLRINLWNLEITNRSFSILCMSLNLTETCFWKRKFTFRTRPSTTVNHLVLNLNWSFPPFAGFPLWLLFLIHCAATTRPASFPELLFQTL